MTVFVFFFFFSFPEKVLVQGLSRNTGFQDFKRWEKLGRSLDVPKSIFLENYQYARRG